MTSAAAAEGYDQVNRPSLRGEQFVVYDNVLSDQQFERLFRFVAAQDFAFVHRTGWRKVWRIYDGDPLRAPTHWYRPMKEGSADPRHPTGTPLDDLIVWIADRLPDLVPIIGDAGSDWAKLSLTPWIYPVGSGLSLHQDGSTYSGAFTYFVHREWRLHWGGQLLVLDPATQPRSATRGEVGPAFLDDRQESARAFDPGFATAVFPKPNRIAFLSPEALHLLTRVDTNAGQASRVSVAGFFHREP